MKSALPFLSIALIFASCTTAYKSGQTPDDVYYSPARPVAERNDYVQRERKDDRQYRYDEEAYRDDRYLRMKIRDRRYADLYDDYYSYNPYYYHYYNGSLSFNSPWSSYSYWNYYYNPYCSKGIIVAPGTPAYSHTPVVNRPRTFDLNVYNPQSANNKVPRTYSSGSSSSSGTYRSNNNNYRGSGNNAGGFLRDVFGGSSSSSSSSSGSSNAGTRSVPSSSSSSSGSSSSGSRSSGSTNAPARRF